MASTDKAPQAAVPHEPASTEDNLPQGEITAPPPALQPEVDQKLENEHTERFFKRLRKDSTDNACEKAELRRAYLDIEQLEHRIRQQDKELAHYQSEALKSLLTLVITDK